MSGLVSGLAKHKFLSFGYSAGRQFAVTLGFAAVLSIANAESALSQQQPAANASGLSTQGQEQATISGYRLSYYLPAWRTLHLHDAEKAKQQLATLKTLGCVMQQRDHAGHIDVTFRCNEWKVLVIEEKEKAEGWVTWLKANGFDISLTKADPKFAVGAESVDFRLVQWKRIHGDGSASEADLISNLKKLGVEVVVEPHGNHNDISFRAPTWRSIRVADHSQAEQWMSWLKQVGFETKHEH